MFKGLLLTIGLFFVLFICFFIREKLRLFFDKRKNGVSSMDRETYVDYNKIPVSPEKCKVVAANYNIPEEEFISPRVSLLDKKSFSSEMAIHEKNSSYIVCEIDYQGTLRKFISSLIPKDEVTVRYRLLNNEPIWLYISNLNSEDYFFDLNFLK